MALNFNITDVFYYDYILYAIIQMYNNDNGDEILPYLQIASIFSVNFDLKHILLDEEAYIKSVYIKLFQYGLKGTKEAIDDSMNAILNVSDKYKEINNDEKFQLIKKYIHICYRYVYKKEFRIEYLNEICEEKLWSENLECLDEFLRFKIIENLKNMKFKEPAIYVFSNIKYKEIIGE